jgi:spermidine/putrescine transport system substrate-binding protein
MKKKVILLTLVLALCAVIALPGCSKAGASKEVNVFNWGEYIDESIFKKFEADTGITVNYSTFESNEAMYSTLKIGGANYDVIIPSDYMVSRLIAENMLEKLDFANIPNAKLTGETFANVEYDPTGEYSAGYMWGTVGIIYNTTMIEDEVTSWDALFDSNYSGQILMFNNPRDAAGIALKYLGYSLNTTDESEIRAAFDLLAAQKPLLQAYVMDQIFDKLESGEAAIGPYYAGDYIIMKEANPDLAFSWPSEGSNRFRDAMCVPKGAANKKNAELFINYMLSTEVCLQNMDMTGYISANVEAAAEYGADLDPDDYAVQFPTEAKLQNFESFYNLPQETLALYDTLWTKLKS